MRSRGRRHQGHRVVSIATWDGAAATIHDVPADCPPYYFALFDDGHGTRLYASNGAYIGGAYASGFMNWDGQSAWISTGAASQGANAPVDVLTVLDDGSGPALYAGGRFTAAGGAYGPWIAKHTDEGWRGLGNGLGPPHVDPDYGMCAIAAYNGSIFAGAFLGGVFRFDGGAWSIVEGLDVGLASVLSLTVFDDGTGPALFVAGDIYVAGRREGIVKLQDSTWTPLGHGLNGVAQSCTIFDDGSGPALYVSGTFQARNVPHTANVARWEGGAWSPLDDGLRGAIRGGSPVVYSLAAFDDGQGPALYAGGNFSSARETALEGFAKWDGQSWTAIPSPMFGALPFKLTSHEDSSGSALIAGGSVDTPGDYRAFVSRWDGATWTEFGAPDAASLAVIGLASFPHEGEPALWVGGDFDGWDGVDSANLAVWRPRESVDGDVNGDRRVTLGDLAILISNFSTPNGASRADGDLDGDGDVDLADLAPLLNAFGTVCP